MYTHYSKSQIFVQKLNFDQNPNIFTSFSSKFFLTIFLVKSKLSTAKKSKTTTFSRVFHPQKIDNFLGKPKLNFWTKNEDFEQCEDLHVPFLIVQLEFTRRTKSVERYWQQTMSQGIGPNWSGPNHCNGYNPQDKQASGFHVGWISSGECKSSDISYIFFYDDLSRDL